MYNRAVLELDGDRLIVQLHKEPAAKPQIEHQIRRGSYQTERRGRAKEEPIRTKGERVRGALPDELHLGGPDLGKERRRRGESAEAAGGADACLLSRSGRSKP